MTVKYLKKRMAENEVDGNMRERNTDKKTESMDGRKEKENNNNTETNEENMQKRLISTTIKP